MKEISDKQFKIVLIGVTAIVVLFVGSKIYSKHEKIITFNLIEIISDGVYV